MVYKNIYQVENELKRLSRKILNSDLEDELLNKLIEIIELNNIEWSKRNQKSKLNREIEKVFKNQLKTVSYSEHRKWREFKTKYIDLISKSNRIEFV